MKCLKLFYSNRTVPSTVFIVSLHNCTYSKSLWTKASKAAKCPKCKCKSRRQHKLGNHASLTRILLSFIWIFWETISAQWGSPRKSQSSRPSTALSQANGCSSSSVAFAGGPPGSWKTVAESPPGYTTTTPLIWLYSFMGRII